MQIQRKSGHVMSLAITYLICSPVGIRAKDNEPLETMIKVPDGNTLEIAVPAGWKFSKSQHDASMPPTLRFEPADHSASPRLH